MDAAHEICRGFPFDHTFAENFSETGVEARHIGGHTPGFTFYFFEDCLFICDYVFLENGHMRYNPFGPPGDTVAGGNRLRDFLQGKDFAWVCGVNYVAPFADWREKYNQMPIYDGY